MFTPCFLTAFSNYYMLPFSQHLNYFICLSGLKLPSQSNDFQVQPVAYFLIFFMDMLIINSNMATLNPCKHHSCTQVLF